MSSSGQIVGGAIGAIAGYFMGNPWLGAQIGLSIGGLLDPPKGPNVEGPRISDRSVQTASYGQDIPRVYGACAIAGNVIWLEGNQIKETITRKKTGGKGGSKKQTTTTYSYSATFAVGLCKGPIVGVRRIRIAKQLIYDAGSSDSATIAASNAAAQDFRVYLGNDTQLPDARIQADVGVANAPAWRGLAYIVFDDLALAKYGNTLMGTQVEVEILKLGAVKNYVGYDASAPSVTTYLRPAWNGSLFCTIDKYGSTCMTSPDGVFWTPHAMPFAGWDLIGNIGSNFIATSSGTDFYTSPDGSSWTPTSFGAAGSVSEPNLAYSGSNYVMITRLSTSLTSANGFTWVNHSLPHTIDSYPDVIWSATYNVYMTAYHYTGSPDKSVFATSTNGASWSEIVLPVLSIGWFRLCEKNGTIVLTSRTGSEGGILVSTNGGASWTFVSVFGGASTSGITTDGEVFLVTGNSGYSYSKDGFSWSSMQYTTLITAFAGSTWNGSVFCAPKGGNSVSRCATIVPTYVSAIDDTLAGIVSAECNLSGLLTSADIDVSALTSTVHGYRVGAVGALSAGLDLLRAAFPFDAVQHGYKLRFVPRGGGSVATIGQADLDARTLDQSPGVQILSVREMDSQLPRRVTVQHLDPNREYAVGAQYAERLNTQAANAIMIDVPVSLTSAEAAAIAEMLLFLYWTERFEVTFSLPPTFLSLEPGDVVSLTTPEGSVLIRLTEVTEKVQGIVQCKGKFSVPAVYSPTALGANASSTGISTIVPVGASVYQLLDLPHLMSAQDGPAFIVAMTGALTGWDGGVLLQSTDAGANWLSIAEIDPPGATFGTCANPLGVSDYRSIDASSVLTVTLTQGQLFSVSQLSLFNGSNLFAYGAPGRWEILSAQTCTLSTGKTYTMSNLLRGRYGTDWAMGTHQTGDYLILLNTSDLAVVPMSSGAIGISWLYRGITVGTDLSTDANRSFAYTGVNLKPLAPVYLTGNRDSGGDWELSWVRRTRSDGDWRDYVDAAISEVSESYHIEIYADAGFSTVKRTITAASASSIYALSDQTDDFGSSQSTLYLKIYQISSTVGRGYPLQSSLTR